MKPHPLAGIYPPLASRVVLILVEAAARGHPLVIVGTVRSVAQQAALWAQGRTRPGAPPYTVDHPLGRTVTKCDGVRIRSNHQAHADGYGHAVDLAFVVDGQPSWAESCPWWLLGALAKQHGLKWGGDFAGVDRPHVELIR